jgi:ATP-dependent RNA helicase DDX19/DBP5
VVTDQNPDAMIPQTDGAPAALNGSDLQDQEDYEVEVKLSDLQADPNNPLYSAKTFEELELCVLSVFMQFLIIIC